MKKIAIVYATYDGVVNSMCGVGVISRAFISCFEDVRRFFLKKNIDLALHLITPKLVPAALGYSQDILNESQKVTARTKGDIHYIINGTNGIEQFGNVDNWSIFSAAAANTTLEIAQRYDETLVYCVDPPYMYTSHYIDLQKGAYQNEKITSVLVLHSDVLCHHPEEPDMRRLAWEASSIKYACLKDSIRFARTSEYLMRHLSENYGIQQEKIISLQSGIDMNNKRYKPVQREEIVRKLKEYNIPLNKDLVFSVGRAVTYKGFDLLIQACGRLRKPAHLVFVAAPAQFPPANVYELQKLIKKYKVDCTPIFHLEFDLPSKICQWENTKIVAQLSRHEPFGLLPEEVRLWAKQKGPVILTSDVEGYVEQIEDGEDGFKVDIGNIATISEKIDYILSLPNDTITDIKKKGLARLLRDYDYRISIFKSILELLEIKDLKVQDFKNSLNYENLH
ncbi:glycosyltransferase [Candidatus Dojkabacteria bacterium]|nr:glycosyltransferase [Candidatus Dojkabacteria bacterium]